MAVTQPLEPTAGPQPRAPAAPERRLRALGAAALDDCTLLALAIGLPTATCRRLLDATDGLRGLALRDPAELDDQAGLTPSGSSALSAIFELGRRVAASACEPDWQIRSPEDVAARLSPAMRHLEREELRVLLLTTKNVVSSMVTVYVGNLAGSSVRVGEVFRDAVRRQSAAIVVVHNHPSGDPSPSPDDLRITGELAAAGRLLDIELLDHVVVAARGWVSLRALGAT